MIHILAEISVTDSTKFLEIFSTKGLAARRAHGCLKSQIFQSGAGENQLIILFEWKSANDFQEFLANAEVKETMKEGGMTAPPKFTFLEKTAEFAA